jgi:hypothetical protein
MPIEEPCGTSRTVTLDVSEGENDGEEQAEAHDRDRSDSRSAWCVASRWFSVERRLAMGKPIGDQRRRISQRIVVHGREYNRADGHLVGTLAIERITT